MNPVGVAGRGQILMDHDLVGTRGSANRIVEIIPDTPITQEPLRVVVRLAVGAPALEFAVAVAPIAPDPLVPEVSTPVKLITVKEQLTL